ncbi:E3 ubiquitin-protein ligase SINA-like 3 [Lolium perenne]|uniref:E3 ubiquitin-protein ligase SINA-like 3 n=1 Tax=Lolium perenne TaxID=4522 RepID=UPI003A99CFA8
MEHVVKSVIVGCSNAKYGCAEQVSYYHKEEHEKACPNAPCFCPESACGFAGSTMALLGHLASQHKCPLSTYHESGAVNVCLYLELGLRALHCSDDNQIFLFNMASEAFGHAIFFVWVQPKVIEPTFTCHMHCDSSTPDDSQSSSCTIRSSSLSDGLPAGYDLIVPKGKVSDEENGIMLRADIHVTRKVFYHSDYEPPLGCRKGKVGTLYYSNSDGKPPRPLAARFIPECSDSDDEQPLAARFSKICG